MNYHIDHNVFKEPYIAGLKGSQKTASFMALNAIRHFTKHAGGMDFYSTKFAKDFGWKPKTMKKALDGLVEAGLIQCVREYQRKGNIPRRYIAKRYGPKGNKVWPEGRKGMARRDKVKELNNNSKPQDDDLDQSSPAKLVPYSDAWFEYINNINK